MAAQLSVSVIVAARNEEKNIRKCLASLAPAQEIFLVDSGSADETAKIAFEEFGAKVHQFHYQGGYPKKRQWALDTLYLAGDWVLLVDADEVIPAALWREIAVVANSGGSETAYIVAKGFHFLGRRFRHGGFSHGAVVLFRKGTARFEELFEDNRHGMDMEVHERVIVEGPIGHLATPLVHEDLKGLEAYLERHNLYSTWEAKLRLSALSTGAYGRCEIAPRLLGNTQERRRFFKKIIIRMPFEPTIWFLYHYVFRAGFLEGYPGFAASRIRAQYIFQVRAKLKELRQNCRDQFLPS